MAMFLFMLTQNYEMALVSFYQGFRITLSAVDILRLLMSIRRSTCPGCSAEPASECQGLHFSLYCSIALCRAHETGDSGSG